MRMYLVIKFGLIDIYVFTMCLMSSIERNLDLKNTDCLCYKLILNISKFFWNKRKLFLRLLNLLFRVNSNEEIFPYCQDNLPCLWNANKIEWYNAFQLRFAWRKDLIHRELLFTLYKDVRKKLKECFYFMIIVREMDRILDKEKYIYFFRFQIYKLFI